MLRRDHILVMIEEFAKVIGHVLQLHNDGRKDEALLRLRGAYSAFFREEPEMIRHLHPSQLLKKLVTQDGFTPAQVEIFAQGLRAEADMLLETDPEQAKDRYVKALAFYEYAEQHDTGNYSVVRRNAIEEIKFSISAL